MRKWIANKLARWARRIYPESEEVMAFHMDRMVDFVVTGQSGIKITAMECTHEGPPCEYEHLADGSVRITPKNAAPENPYGMCPNCVTPWKCNGPHIP